MARPNFKNRTLWTGDNLDVMRGLNSETVDLVYLDPPFNSNRNYAAPIGSEAAGAGVALRKMCERRGLRSRRRQGGWPHNLCRYGGRKSQ